MYILQSWSLAGATPQLVVWDGTDGVLHLAGDVEQSCRAFELHLLHA